MNKKANEVNAQQAVYIQAYNDTDDGTDKVDIVVDFGDSFVFFTKVINRSPEGGKYSHLIEPYDYRIVEYNKVEKLAKLYTTEHVRDEEIDDECIELINSDVYGLPHKDEVEEYGR